MYKLISGEFLIAPKKHMNVDATKHGCKKDVVNLECLLKVKNIQIIYTCLRLTETKLLICVCVMFVCKLLLLLMQIGVVKHININIISAKQNDILAFCEFQNAYFLRHKIVYILMCTAYHNTENLFLFRAKLNKIMFV